MGKFGTCVLCPRPFWPGCENGKSIPCISVPSRFFLFLGSNSFPIFLHVFMITFFIFQYQNCLKRFCYSTDAQVLLYLARTHYEAEQWQDCKRTLLRAIHLAPSNYTLRFDAGVAMQKFSASTLQKTKRSADEVCWYHVWSFFRWYHPWPCFSSQSLRWWKIYFISTKLHEQVVCVSESESGRRCPIWKISKHRICIFSIIFKWIIFFVKNNLENYIRWHQVDKGLGQNGFLYRLKANSYLTHF